MGGSISQQTEAPREVTKDLFTAKNVGIVSLIIVAMLILIVLILYIVDQVKKTKLQHVSLQKNVPTDLIELNNRQTVPFRVPANNMSLVSNGQEFSYSFWIFLGSAYSATAGPKMILTRGNGNTYSGSTLTVTSNTSPLIFLDASTNAMYFAVNTSAVKTAMTPSQVVSQAANGTFNSGWMVAKVAYVPLQRWVFMTMTLQQTSLNVYLDGDLYSVATLGDIAANIPGPTPIVNGTGGDLLIGDNVNYTPGYIAKAAFYNYALVQSDIQTMYAAGPNKTSWLGYVGMGNYGVRSPIYQIS